MMLILFIFLFYRCASTKKQEPVTVVHYFFLKTENHSSHLIGRFCEQNCQVDCRREKWRAVDGVEASCKCVSMVTGWGPAPQSAPLSPSCGSASAVRSHFWSPKPEGANVQNSLGIRQNKRRERSKQTNKYLSFEDDVECVSLCSFTNDYFFVLVLYLRKTGEKNAPKIRSLR